MFILTPLQSRTHVDTVQNILLNLGNSRHICWIHTMKVIGSHVTLIRRNSPRMVILRHIYFVMKIWSHLFEVNVQMIAVVYVVKISNV